MTATDTAVDAVENVVESVVESVPTGHSSAFVIGAFLVGAGIGGGVGYLLANRRLAAKYQAIAEAEIAEMREHYVAKIRAAESAAQKRPVQDIVKAKGYASPEADTSSPPMAVQPPASVAASEDDSAGEPLDDSAMAADEVEGPAGVRSPDIPVAPAPPSPEIRNLFRDREDSPEDEWDWHEERKRRSPDIPYVIHYDERNEFEGYDDMTLTYYEGDDVVCDERDTVIDPDRRNAMFGDANLEKFGHGSNAPEIVYVRNDQLEIVFEIIKSPQSYAEEVHGFSHEGYDRGNLVRMRARERDESEE